MEEFNFTEGDLFITATIGYGQKGNTTVKLDGKKIFQGQGLKKHLIGKIEDLKGKTLRIVTIVDDTSARTDNVFVEYVFDNNDKIYKVTPDDQDESTQSGKFVFEKVFQE